MRDLRWFWCLNWLWLVLDSVVWICLLVWVFLTVDCWFIRWLCCFAVCCDLFVWVIVGFVGNRVLAALVLLLCLLVLV